MKKSFILHIDSLSILAKMPDDMAGKFIKLIYHFQLTGELLEMDFALEMAITPFINQFERDNEIKDYENRETFVYHVLLSNKNTKFVKIGISYFLDQRYSDYKRLGYDVNELFVESFDSKSLAIEREQELHSLFKDYKFLPIDKFIGYTECFSTEILKYLGI